MGDIPAPSTPLSELAELRRRLEALEGKLNQPPSLPGVNIAGAVLLDPTTLGTTPKPGGVALLAGTDSGDPVLIARFATGVDQIIATQP